MNKSMNKKTKFYYLHGVVFMKKLYKQVQYQI